MMRLLKIFMLAAFLAIAAPEAGSFGHAAAQTSDADFELGKRYLKLGNTYREGGDFNRAAEFLNKGLAVVKSRKSGWESKYWTAVAYEFLAYLYRDMGMQDQAIKNMKDALFLYTSLVTMNDGSPDASREVIQNLVKMTESFEAGANKGDAPIGDSQKLLLSGIKSFSMNEFDEAIVEFDQAIRLDPESEVAYAWSREARDRAGTYGAARCADPDLARAKVYTDLAEALKNPSEVYFLDLSGGDLQALPASIGSLSNLRRLDLSNNSLTRLPESICNLQCLEDLDLENNLITEFPACFHELPGLKYLNIKLNELSLKDVTDLVRFMPNTVLYIDDEEY
ncbi:MAG: leucine-rich repeat domain-containing protein [Bacteroidota bacterium]